MKRLCCFLIIIIVLPVLTGCTLFPSKLQGVERLLVVQAMGVDASDGTVRLSMVSSADSSRGEGPVRLAGSGATIRDAADDIVSRTTEEELLSAHTGQLLLGEESARAGVDGVLRYVCRSREIRMDVPLLIVRGGSAERALLDTGDERIGAAEILEALRAAAPSRDGFSPPSVARIAGQLEEGGCALASAVVCTAASEQAEDGAPLTLAPAGCAVIRDGVLAGFIEQEDVAALDLIGGARGVHDFIVTDAEGQRVTLQTAPGRAVVTPLRGETGELRGAEIALALSASVAEIDGRGALSDGEYADALAALLEREILRRAGKLVQLEKTLDADFLGLEERIALCSSSRERALDRERGVDYASLPLRLSVSVSISHSNDVRDG